MNESGSTPASPLSGFCHSIPNVGDTERWISLGSGIVLAGYGLRRGNMSGILATLVGGSLIYRGMSGHCSLYQSLGVNTKESSATGVPAQLGVKIEKSFEANRPAQELYDLWRDLEQLPQHFSHLKEVRIEEGNRSHWIAAGPFNRSIEWDAEVFVDHPGQLISWQSLPGGDVQTAGSIHFQPIDQQRTQVSISLKYNPPGGQVGDWIASWLGDNLEQILERDLEGFQDSIAEASLAPVVV